MALRGIKVGSSNRYTSPVPTNANAYFLTADARLAAGQLRHAAWDYYQADTGTGYRIKPLVDCFLSDGATPATQGGSWGTLEAHWTAALTQESLDDALDAVGGNLTPGKVAYVEGNASNDMAPRLGDPLRPFQTVPAAISAILAVSTTGTVKVRPGGTATDSLGRPCYNDSLIVVPNGIYVEADASAVFSANINVGSYGGSSQNLRAHWNGGIVLNQISALRQANSPYYVVISNVRLEGLGIIQAFSQFPGGSGGTHTDILEVRNCWGRNANSGGLCLTGNENFGFQRTIINVWDSDFEVAGGPSLKIVPHTTVQANASKVVRRGSTRFASGSGNPIMISTPAISGAVNPDYVLLDERPVPDVPASLYGAGPLQLIAVSASKKTWAVASGGGGTPAPTISGASPNSGAVGSTSTLTGTNFATPSAFTLGGTAITAYTVNSATSITFTVPTGATTGVISITIGGQTATSTGNFTVGLPRMAVAVGDSITEGYGLGSSYMTLCWPPRLAAESNTVYPLVVNKGVSGNTTDDVLARMSNIVSAYDFTNYSGVDVYLLIGVNNFGAGNTIAKVETDDTTIITQLKAPDPSKVRVYLMTLTATSGYYTALDGNNTRDLAVQAKINDHNAAIRANAVSTYGATAFVDTARVVQLQDGTNTTYFSDGLHPTAAGHQLIADAVNTYSRTGAQPTGPILTNFDNPTLIIETPSDMMALASNANGSRVQSTAFDSGVNNCAYSSQAMQPGSPELVGVVDFVTEDLTDKVLGVTEGAITGFGQIRYGAYLQPSGNVIFFSGGAPSTLASGSVFGGVVVGDVIRCEVNLSTIKWLLNGVVKATINRGSESFPLRSCVAMEGDPSTGIGTTAIRWKAAAYQAPVA